MGIVLVLKITNIDGEKGATFPFIKIELDMVPHNKQNDFLSNELNKRQFISRRLYCSSKF